MSCRTKYFVTGRPLQSSKLGAYAPYFFRAKAVCKFECRSYIFYIEDVNIYDNRKTVKFISEGLLSPQHTSGTIVHSRHLSYSEQNTVGESLFHSSVSKVYHKQFINSENFESFSYGNLTHLKSQECLRSVKSEIRSQNRFSGRYSSNTTIISIFVTRFSHSRLRSIFRTRSVYSPYVYCTSKQIELLKLVKNHVILLNLDATR